DVKKPAVPLIARERIDARMTSRIASNAVFSASDRLLLKRTMTSVIKKMKTARRETCVSVRSLGCNPKPRSCETKSDKAFIQKLIAAKKRGERISMNDHA